MKTLFKTKMALLLVLSGLAFSCKKNDTATDTQYTDSTATETTVDTAGIPTDTAGVNSGTGAAAGAGTEGTTGKGSGTTGGAGGAGSAGSAADTTATRGR